MGSRSNDDNQEKAYGDTGRPMLTSYQPPSSAARLTARPSNPSAVRAAMSADRGTTKPMPISPRPNSPPGADGTYMPFAKRGEQPVGIGGAARRNKIDELVNKMDSGK
jgi:hypothetical protein